MILGLELALMGMGTVFTFLLILIVFTTWMSQLAGHFEASSVKENKEGAIQSVHMTAHNSHHLTDKMSNETLRKIITAAVQQHRSSRMKH